MTAPVTPPRYRPASRFVLRTPLLPFDVLAQWTGDVEACRATLRQVFEDAAVREAVFVASPELHAKLDEWVERPETPNGQGIERALVRYLSRMAGRPTPFGMFSGVAVGTIGAASRLELPPRAAYRRHTRLDNDYLFTACADLARTPALAAELRFTPNTSLYTAAARFHYAEGRVADKSRSYHLVAVDPSEYLVSVLERARGGATRAELAAVLCADPEISEEDAAGFLDELIDTQLLVSELQPPVTGDEPTARLIEVLARRPAGAAAAAVLRDAMDRIAVLDATPPGAPVGMYREIARVLRDGVPTAIEHDHVVQVDLIKPPGTTLGARVIDELGRSLDLLRRIGLPGRDGDDLATFRQRFTARYETREVPLVEVLDDEIGIGFGGEGAGTGGAPLLADLAFPFKPEPRKVTVSGPDAHLMGLLAAATRAGATEIELSDHDIERLERATPARLSDTVSISAVIAAESMAALDAGNYSIRVIGSSGGTGARMLGRFCHGSADVDALTREVIADELALRPDLVQAEVVHLPEGRIGNILLRPVLRPYEIVYLGTSGAPTDQQLPVTDLLVSVVGERIVLRSRRLGRAIWPRLTSAHNYGARSLGVYRFLCSLGEQDGGGVGWGWGVLADTPFLPRLRRGRLVLARARWLLGAADLEPLDAASKGSNAAKTPAQIRALRARQATAVVALRERRGLPRWIVVSDGDNELPIDLDNPLMVDSFVHLVKGRSSATLCELYPGPDQLCATGPEGAFVHELVVPFVRVAEPAAAVAAAEPRRTPAAAGPDVSRRFLPGSPWVFVKIYGGTASADLVLREVIGPLVRAALADGLADRWFFLRYSDPDPHLRVRFAGDPGRLIRELVPRVHAALAGAVDAGLIWRVVIDTYEREIERYGGPAAIELAEQVFAADSDAVLAIVEASRGDAGADAAWRLALRGIDRLLDDLGLDLAAKLAAMTLARDEFGAEVGMDTAFQRRLGDKFRKHRSEIEALLAARDDDDEHPLGTGLVAFAARSTVLRPIADELRARRDAGRLTRTIPDIARSFVHMHVNRMLSSAQRAHEVVIYDLLRRHYDGVAARARAPAQNKP